MYTHNSSLTLGVVIQKQEACTGDRQNPPVNSTWDLVDTQQDFVAGAFADMQRSRSTVENRKTRGYKDVMLLLALEDIKAQAALVTPLPNGYRLRFFVGMAHIKTSKTSTRLFASFSESEIVADITDTYTYATETSADFTFIQDISVSLREVRALQQEAAKLAIITIFVPHTMISSDFVNMIPKSSIVAAVGYSKEDAMSSGGTMRRVSPCVQTYSGKKRVLLDKLLQDQAWCSQSDGLVCEARWLGSVGNDGVLG